MTAATFSNRPALMLPVLLIVNAGPVSAQPAAPRPNTAVFGGAAVAPSKHDVFYVTFSAAAGTDENAAAADAAAAVSGTVTTLDPRLVYARDGKNVQVAASAGSDLRFYGTAHTLRGNTHYGTFALSGSSRRTRVSFGQALYYSPAYLSGSLSSASATVGETAAGGTFGVSGRQALFSDSELQVEQNLSRRARIAAVAGYWMQDLLDVRDHPITRGYTAGGRVLFDLWRDATLHTGYVHRQGEYSLTPGRPTVVHDIDFGIDYHRALSFSRRTRVGFEIGSSAVNGSVATMTSPSLTFRLGGTASLSHDVGRTWRLRAEYRRAVDILQAVAAPVLSDGVTTGVSGFFTRKTDVDVSAAYSRGSVGDRSGASGGLETYTATARLRRALGRRWALFGEGEYYHYEFGSAVPVLGGIPRALDRSRAQAGITLWVPLKRK